VYGQALTKHDSALADRNMRATERIGALNADEVNRLIVRRATGPVVCRDAELGAYAGASCVRKKESCPCNRIALAYRLYERRHEGDARDSHMARSSRTPQGGRRPRDR
jgi:hypothetical protein